MAVAAAIGVGDGGDQEEGDVMSSRLANFFVFSQSYPKTKNGMNPTLVNQTFKNHIIIV